MLSDEYVHSSSCINHAQMFYWPLEFQVDFSIFPSTHNKGVALSHCSDCPHE